MKIKAIFRKSRNGGQRGEAQSSRVWRSVNSRLSKQRTIIEQNKNFVQFPRHKIPKSGQTG
ncbi:MAG: hypothetical protein LUF91_00775 [Oscillospiraceae bacterium]|nr:hypothetical protein [Oscillospiraceae bacterium]